MRTASYTVAVGTRDSTQPAFESVVDGILRLGSCNQACISIQPPDSVTIAVNGGTDALGPANGKQAAVTGVEDSKLRLPQGVAWCCSIHLQPGEGLSQLSQPPVLVATCSHCKESSVSCSAADAVSFLTQHSTHNTAWAQQLQHEPHLSQQLDQLLTQLQQHCKQHPEALLLIQRTAALICVEVAYLLLRSPGFNSSKWLVNLSRTILYHRVMWFLTDCYRPAQVQQQQLGLPQQQLCDPNLLWLLVGAPPYCQSALVIDPTLKHWSLEASCLVALLHRCQLLPDDATQTHQEQQGVAGPTPEQQVVAAVKQLLLQLQGRAAGPVGTSTAATGAALTADIDKPFIEGLLQLRGLSLQDLVAAAWPNSVDTQLDTCVICGDDYDPPGEQLIECITCCHSYHLSCVTDPQYAGVSYTPAATAAAKGGRCLGCQKFPLVAAAAAGGGSSSRSPKKGLPWGSAERASGRCATSAQRRLSYTALPPPAKDAAVTTKGQKSSAPSLENTTAGAAEAVAARSADALGGVRATAAAAAAAGDSSSSNSADLQIIKRRKRHQSSQDVAASGGDAAWPCQPVSQATQGAVDALQQLATAAPAQRKSQQQQQQQARLSAPKHTHPAAATAAAAAGAPAGPAVPSPGSQFTGQSVAAILQSLRGDVTSAAAAATRGAAAMHCSGAAPGLATSATVINSAGRVQDRRSATRQQALAAAAAVGGAESACVSGAAAGAAAAGGGGGSSVGDPDDSKVLTRDGLPEAPDLPVLQLPAALRMFLAGDAAATEPAGAAAHTTATGQKRPRRPEETAQQQQQLHQQQRQHQQQQRQQQQHQHQQQQQRRHQQQQQQQHRHQQQPQQQQRPQDELQRQQPQRRHQQQPEQAGQHPQLLRPGVQRQHPQPQQRQRRAGSSDVSADTSTAGGATLPALLDGLQAEPTESDARSSKRQKTVNPQAHGQQQEQQQTAKQGPSTAAGLGSGQRQSADWQQSSQQQTLAHLEQQQQERQQAPVKLPGPKQQQPGSAAAGGQPQQTAAAGKQPQLQGRQESLQQPQAGAKSDDRLLLLKPVVQQSAGVWRQQQQAAHPKQWYRAGQQSVAGGHHRNPAAAVQKPPQQPAGSKQQQLQTATPEHGPTLQGQQLQLEQQQPGASPAPPQQQTPQQTAPTAAELLVQQQQHSKEKRVPDRQKHKHKRATPSQSPAALSPADHAVLVHSAKLRWQLMAVPDVSMRWHLERLLQPHDELEQQVVDHFIKFWAPGQSAAAAAAGGGVGAVKLSAAAAVGTPAAAGARAGTTNSSGLVAAAAVGRGTSVNAAMVGDQRSWDWAALQEHNVPQELLQLVKAEAATTAPKQQAAKLLRLCCSVVRRAYGISGDATAGISVAAGATAAGIAAGSSAGSLEATPGTGGGSAAAAAAGTGCSTETHTRVVEGLLLQPGSHTAAISAQVPKADVPGLLQLVRQLLSAHSGGGNVTCSSLWKIVSAAVETAMSMLCRSTWSSTRGEAAAGESGVDDLHSSLALLALLGRLSGGLHSTTWDLLWKAVRKDVRLEQQQRLQQDPLGEGPPVLSVSSQWLFPLVAVLRQISDAPVAWEGILSYKYESRMQQGGVSGLPAAAAAVHGNCSKQQTLVKLLYEYRKIKRFSVVAPQQAGLLQGQQYVQGTGQSCVEAPSAAEVERLSAQQRLIPAFDAALVAFSACLGPAQQQPGQQERQRLDQQSYMLPELLVLLLVLMDTQLQVLRLSDDKLQDVLLVASPGVQGSLVDHTVGMVNKVVDLFRKFPGSPRPAGAVASSTATGGTAANALGCVGSSECRCTSHAVAQECRYLAESFHLTLECVRLGAGFTNRTGTS